MEEREKHIGSAIGSKLYVGKDEYESLAEIETWFVKEIVRKIHEVRGHSKFVSVNAVEDFEELLKAEQIKTPTVIPYKLTFLT